MNIGNKIKELRVKNKITQEELAKALQVSTQAVSKWENGGSPDLELIPTIANYFHVSTDYLFDLKQDQIADIEQKLWMYLQSFDMKERMNVVYKLGFYMSVASRNEKMDMLENLKNFFKTEMSNENYYSNIICEEGIIITSLAQDNKIFMCLPKDNQSNYSKILKSDQKQRLFCQYLSDELFYRALIFLYSQNEKNFTESYLKDYLNNSIEQAREILLQMEEFKIVQCSQVPIDDSYLNLYTVLPNPQIVGLNGIVAIIQKDKNTATYIQAGINFDPYGWLKIRNVDGSFSYKKELLFPVIYNNRFNKKNNAESNLPRDYIEIVDEDSFLKNPSKYIESAYQKSQLIDSYVITKQ